MEMKKIAANLKKVEGKLDQLDFNSLKALRAQALCNKEVKATVYHDDKVQKMDSLFFNPQRRVSSIADKILKEIDVNKIMTPNYSHVNFVTNGQVAQGNVIAYKDILETLKMDCYRPGKVEQPLMKIYAKMIVDYSLANNSDIIENAEDRIAQAVIAKENKFVIEMLDKVATVSGNVISVSSFDKGVVNAAIEKLNTNGGFDAKNVICSTEIKCATNTWSDVTPFTRFSIEAQANNADFNNEANIVNNISWLEHTNLLGMDWIAIPAFDAYRVIEPNTCYVLTQPERLGQFVRRMDTTSGGVNNPHTNGRELVTQESFASAILNLNGVIKIVLE